MDNPPNSDNNKIYGWGAQIFPIGPETNRVFYLKNSGRTDTAGNSIRSLFYGDETEAEGKELAEGVEAFRVCVSEDKGGSGKVSEIRSGLTAGIDWKDVTTVQVDVVLASNNHRVLQEDVAYSFALCGDDPTTPSVTMTDRKLRRMFSVSTALRNKLKFVPKSEAPVVASAPSP
jgi:hypothetical protein